MSESFMHRSVHNHVFVVSVPLLVSTKLSRGPVGKLIITKTHRKNRLEIVATKWYQ